MSSYIQQDGPGPADVTLHYVVTTLAERWKSAREAAGLGMNELDRNIQQGSGYTTRIETGEKTNPALDIVERAAVALRVRAAWLAFGDGPRHGMDAAADVKAGTFLLKLDRKRGLRDAVEEEPGRWRISTVVTAMGLELESDSAGIPRGGWRRVLDGIESGKSVETSDDGKAVHSDNVKQIGRRPKLPARTSR